MTHRTLSAIIWAPAAFALALAAAPARAQQPAPSSAPSLTEHEKADDALLTVPGAGAAEGARLVEKALAAVGGATAIDGVRTLAIVSRSKRQTNAGEIEVEANVQIGFPDRYRQDVALNGGNLGTLVGPKGAFLVTGAGALPLPAGERALLEASRDRNLVALLQRAHKEKPACVGFEDLGAVHVHLVRVGGDTGTLLEIDPETGIVHRMTYDSTAAAANGRIRVTYSDYRAAGPIKYPFHSTGTLDDKPLFTNEVKSVKVNVELAAGLFEPPAEKAAAKVPGSGK
jgi:hypothetical protein